MPRPTTKNKLLAAMQSEHDALEQALAGLSKKQIVTVSRKTKWSIKDVISHLTEWERMCMGWYRAGLKGKIPAVPAEGYNWAQLPALNTMLLKKNRHLPWENVRRRFRISYRRILRMVKKMGQEELFTRGRYAWTGKNALAPYIIGSTSSHYIWAKKEIRKCLN
jgi:hypothetical protein